MFCFFYVWYCIVLSYIILYCVILSRSVVPHRFLIFCISTLRRLCKSLEEIHRTSAMQDARKRRNQLAQDCVRLGKIVSVRMVSLTFFLSLSCLILTWLDLSWLDLTCHLYFFIWTFLYLFTIPSSLLFVWLEYSSLIRTSTEEHLFYHEIIILNL